MPGLKMADSAVLREKSIFSPRNASVSEWTLSRILKIKISHDTRQFLRNFFYSEMPRALSSPLLLSCFSVIFLFSLSFSFSTNYFSTPPGVCQSKKSPSHFTHGQQP